MWTETTMHGVAPCKPLAKYGGLTKSQLRMARRKWQAKLGRTLSNKQVVELETCKP